MLVCQMAGEHLICKLTVGCFMSRIWYNYKKAQEGDGEMNLKDTGKFIAERRKELGLTQEKLAQSMNITAKAVSKWERGLSFPDVELLNSLAVTLKCEVSALINGRFRNNEGSNISPTADILDFSDNHAETEKEICFDYTSDKYVSPFLFGNNLEHARSAVHMGLSAQMLENRKFVGKPDRKGCALGWTAIGGEKAFMGFSDETFLGPSSNVASATYTRHAKDYHMKRMLECNSQKIVTIYEGYPCGISQGGLHIEENKKYEFSVAVKTLRDCNLKITLSKDDGNVLCSENITLEKLMIMWKKSLCCRP